MLEGADYSEMPENEQASGHSHLGVIVALAVANAVLFGLAYPAVGLWPLTCVAAAPRVWLDRSTTRPRRAEKMPRYYQRS